MTFPECISRLIQGKRIRKPDRAKKSYPAFDLTNKPKPLCKFNTLYNGNPLKYVPTLEDALDLSHIHGKGEI